MIRKPLLLRLAETLEAWQNRRRERRFLLALGDGALKDLGISRCDAWAEATKPRWKA